MRILYIGLLPPEKGGFFPCGTAIHGWELAQQAHMNGYDVYYMAMIRPGSPSLVDGIKIIGMPDGKLRKLFEAVRSIRYLTRGNPYGRSLTMKEKIAFAGRCSYLRNSLQAISPQLVHVHGRENLWALSVRALSSSLPLIISHHGFISYPYQDKDLIKAEAILNSADYLVLVSRSLLSKEQEVLKGFRGRLKIIHNPIDGRRIPLMDRNQAKKDLGWDNRKVVFFSGICNSLGIKGLDTLLDSFTGNVFLKTSCRLIIISDSEGMEFASRLISEKKIVGDVLGPQSWEKLIAFYNAADVFVMPSRSEAFPLVFLESLLAGVPVVGYQQSVEELAELLGIYIGEPYDAFRESPEDLASKIIKALQADLDRSVIRQSIVDTLSWDSSFPKYDDIYKDLVGRPPRIDRRLV